jgi:hypothetical protein
MFFKFNKTKNNISLDEATKQLFKIVTYNVKDSYLRGIMKGINYKIPLDDNAEIELLLSNYSSTIIELKTLMITNDDYKKIFPELLNKLHDEIYKFISDSYGINQNDFDELTQTRQKEYANLLTKKKIELGKKIYLHLSGENEALMYAEKRDKMLCKMLGVKFFTIQTMVEDYFAKNEILL